MATDPLAAAVAPVAENITANIANSVTTFTGPPAQSWYAVNKKQDAPDEAEVSIYDAIGGWGITADSFVKDLKALDVKTIHLRLNTPGGSVFDGTAIHNALVEHPAQVIVHVDGVAASAGSFIAMAGDQIRMADNTYMMIHNASGGVMGGAEDMRRYADLLEKMNGVIAGMYERKTSKPRDHWLNLMDAETWFTADEAKAQGLADVVEPATKKSAGAKAAFDFTIYNKIPDPVRQMWGIQNAPQTQVTQPPVEAAIVAAPVPAAVTTTTERDSEMSTTTAAPATSAVAPNEIVELNKQAIEGYIAKGRTLGTQEGLNAAIETMKQIYAVCPDRPDLAINAFLTGQNAATVKLAYDAANAASTKAADELRRMQTENARLQAVIATGGHPGVSIAVTEGATVNVPQGMDPDAQAQLEWDSDPMIRAQNGGDAGKKHWLLFRTNQLKGGVRVLSRAS